MGEPKLAGVRHRVAGLPLYIWLLWAGAAVVLAACPMMLSDPALWFYLLDPELLALLVLVGVQYTRWEVGLLLFRARDRLRGARRTTRAVRHGTLEP